MQQDWEKVSAYYAREALQPSGLEGRQLVASAGARAEFGWLIDKAPEWAGGDLNFITELDITGGVDPSSLDDAELDRKIGEFVAVNPCVFEKFTKDGLDGFSNAAKIFARYGAESAQGFKLDESESCSVIFIQNISRRNFAQTMKRGLGCSIAISACDDAAMTIMHECAHLLKKHSHRHSIDELRNETEAESLMVKSFENSILEGRDLNPQSLQPRLAFRSLGSLLWTKKREIEKINDPIGTDEGFGHGMNVGLSLTGNLLADNQSAALLRAPVQINSLIYSFAGVDPYTDMNVQDRRHYFSALSALHSEGCFGESTLAGVYVDQAIQACQTHAEEWLDEDLIAAFKTKLEQTNLPEVKWDDTDDLFQPQHEQNVATANCDSKLSPPHL
jgi:hypothetical protein